MRAATRGTENVEHDAAREAVAAGQLGADHRVASGQLDVGRCELCGAIRGRQLVDGFDQATDERARKRRIDHREGPRALVGTARVAPGDRGLRDRPRPATSRDEEQHGVRDLAETLVEAACEELVAGLIEDGDRGVGVIERVELCVDQPFERAGGDRQLREFNFVGKLLGPKGNFNRFVTCDVYHFALFIWQMWH